MTPGVMLAVIWQEWGADVILLNYLIGAGRMDVDPKVAMEAGIAHKTAAKRKYADEIIFMVILISLVSRARYIRSTP